MWAWCGLATITCLGALLACSQRSEKVPFSTFVADGHRIQSATVCGSGSGSGSERTVVYTLDGEQKRTVGPADAVDVLLERHRVEYRVEARCR